MGPDRRNFGSLRALIVICTRVPTLHLCYMRLHSFSANQSICCTCFLLRPKWKIVKFTLSISALKTFFFLSFYKDQTAVGLDKQRLIEFLSMLTLKVELQPRLNSLPILFPWSYFLTHFVTSTCVCFFFFQNLVDLAGSERASQTGAFG